MNIEALFPSNCIKASDLGNKPTLVKIAGVEAEQMRDGETRAVVYFADLPKGLILNVTNKNTLVDLYGGDTDRWAGKSIQMVTATTDYAGRVVDCVRLRPPPSRRSRSPSPPMRLTCSTTKFLSKQLSGARPPPRRAPLFWMAAL
jgi:hypothetical protein